MHADISNQFRISSPTPFMVRLFNILEKNFHDSSFDISKLGQLLNICPMQTYRKVKLQSGLTPAKLSLKYRMEKATVLLLDTELSISEIAWKTGFKTQSSFTRAFKRSFNCSPCKRRQKFEKEVIKWQKEVIFRNN